MGLAPNNLSFRLENDCPVNHHMEMSEFTLSFVFFRTPVMVNWACVLCITVSWVFGVLGKHAILKAIWENGLLSKPIHLLMLTEQLINLSHR